MTGIQENEYVGTLNMERQDSPGGSFTVVDLSELQAHDFKVSFSASQPGSLEFSIVVSQHEMPLPYHTYIRFWVTDGLLPDGTNQGATNPLFAGFVEVIEPDESNRINVIAYDPISRVGKEYMAMNVGWESSGGSSPPEPGIGATPRLVFNSKIDNDDDLAFERRHSATVQEMIATVLDDASPALLHLHAAASGEDPYSFGATMPLEPQGEGRSRNHIRPGSN